MDLVSWNRFISRDLAVEPELMGRSHSFVFDNARVIISLPQAVAADRDSKFDEVATVREWRDPGKVPTRYEVLRTDVTVNLGSCVDLPTDLLSHKPNAYDIIPAETQAQLDGLAKRHEQIAERAFDYWLTVLRWATDDYRLGRPGIDDNRTGWSTRLNESTSGRSAWLASQGIVVGWGSAMTASQWEAAERRLQGGIAPPIYVGLRHDALQFSRHGDYRRSIVDLAVSCETFLRHHVLASLPGEVDLQIKKYVEDANINQYVSKFFPATLNADEAKIFKTLKPELESLFSKRNDVVHRGESNGATAANCERFARVLAQLFALGNEGVQTDAANPSIC